jgi:hypothetical protein
MSYQNDFNANGAQVVHSVDNATGASNVNLLGSNLVVTPSLGEIGPSAAGADFTYTSHLSETYTFFANQTNDIIDFAPGFGNATIKEFASTAVSDIVNLTQLFASFTDAQKAMSPANGGSDTLVKDGAGDTLTLVGVSMASITAPKLGFS